MVPQLTDLRKEILREFHCSLFVMHLGDTKMYRSPVLLERDKATRCRFCLKMSHVSAGKG